MGGRPGLPGIAVESAAATTVAANGGLSTWGFNTLNGRITASFDSTFTVVACYVLVFFTFM